MISSSIQDACNSALSSQITAETHDQDLESTSSTPLPWMMPTVQPPGTFLSERILHGDIIQPDAKIWFRNSWHYGGETTKDDIFVDYMGRILISNAAKVVAALKKIMKDSGYARVGEHEQGPHLSDDICYVEHEARGRQDAGGTDGWSSLPFNDVRDNESCDLSKDQVDDKAGSEGWYTDDEEAEDEDPDWRRRWLSDYTSHLWYWWSYSAHHDVVDDAYASGFPDHLASCGILCQAERPRCSWYHVHPQDQVCVLCLTGALLTSDSLPAAVSAISRMPPEVIHKIVEMSHEVYMNALGIQPRRPTGPALVCRHWADVCLRGAMEAAYIDKLYGRHDVMTLRALVSAQGSYLKRNITYVCPERYHLDEDEDRFNRRSRENEPWLHLLPATCSLLPNLRQQEHRVQIRGPLCKGLKTMRSIHAYLPRSLPSAFSRGIKDLSLDGIQFRQFADLQHVLDELPSLQYFGGRDLSWPPGVPEMPRPPHHMAKDFQRTKAVELTRCTFDYEATTLFASFQYDRSWLSSIRSVAASFAPSGSGWSSHRVDVQSREDLAWKYNNGELNQYPGSILCEIDSTLDLDTDTNTLGCYQRIYQIRALLVIPLVGSLHVPFPRDSEPVIRLNTTASVDSFDWKTFDEAVTAHFSHPGVIEFDRRRPPSRSYNTKEYNEWKPLTEDDKRFITERLPLLSAAGRISVVMRSPEEDEYGHIPSVPVSDGLEDRHDAAGHVVEASILPRLAQHASA